MKYSDTGVSYEELDPVKLLFSVKNESTHDGPVMAHNIEYRQESKGESAAVYDFRDYDFMIAFVAESLGTKIFDADRIKGKTEIAKLFTGKKLYAGFGIDMAAMIVYDLNNVGALPIGIADIIASGDSDYFARHNQDRTEELVDGFIEGANLSEASLATGDLPTYPGIVNPETLCICGAGFGIIKPKSRFTEGGRKIKEGDVIYGLGSSGIHSNGLSLSRAIIEKQPEGYASKLENGQMIGEAILTQSRIYSQLLRVLFEREVELKYISHVTGHAFQGKVARPKMEFTYVIEWLPEPQPEFRWLMEKGPVSKIEAYKTWNMGVGLILIASEEQENIIEDEARERGIDSWKIGHVEKGPRRVVMPFKEDGKPVVYTP